jgi:HNH endonuclease
MEQADMSEATFGDPLAEGRDGGFVARLKVCTECGREAKRLIRKKCATCYERARRAGAAPVRTWPLLDPEFEALLLPVPRTNHTFARRVFAYIDPSGDCWEWTGTIRDDGYGTIGRGGRGRGNMVAHLAVRELLVGPVPDGMVHDHLCRNRSCVNPDHGEIVTPGENTKRGYGASHGLGERKVCNFGHPLDGIIRNGRGRVVRYCKTCARDRTRAKYVPKPRAFDSGRAREVILRSKAGERPADIARAMNIDYNAAKRIARDWRNGGYQSLGIPVAA